MLTDTLPTKIRRLRIILELSQENLGHALGMSQYAYSKIENGQTALSLKHLQAIAQCFRCDVSDLILLPLEDLIRRLSPPLLL